MFIGYAVAFLSTLILGVTADCIALILEGWLYNQLEGTNKSCLVRNFLNVPGI